MNYRPAANHPRNGDPSHPIMPVVTERRLGQVVRLPRPLSWLTSATAFLGALGRGALTMGIACCCAGAAPVEFHVATNGNDAWSGALCMPNASRTDGPWASLEGARTGIRKWRAAQGLPAGGVQVTLHAGTYVLDRPLGLTQEDSGTREAQIVYGAASGAEVRISGGREIGLYSDANRASWPVQHTVRPPKAAALAP